MQFEVKNMQNMDAGKAESPKLRAISSELNVLTRSDGSAIITQGLSAKTRFSSTRLTFFCCF
jgi:ribonuclease PH